MKNIHFVALLEHPEFQRGLAGAQEQFLEEYAPAPLTKGQMINEVETTLGRRVVERSEAVLRLDGDPHSYFYNLGFVFGTINEGLTYTIGQMRKENHDESCFR